jgi:hypothetical protein
MRSSGNKTISKVFNGYQSGTRIIFTKKQSLPGFCGFTSYPRRFSDLPLGSYISPHTLSQSIKPEQHMTSQATLFSLQGPPLEGDAVLSGPNGHNINVPSPMAIEDSGVDLARKTVFIKVRLSTIGNTRKVSTSLVEVDADKDLLRVSKHLLDSTELKAISRLDGEIRRYLYNICLPFEVGIHLLPVAALETVEHRLREFRTEREALVAAFVAVYPNLCLDASTRLRGLYNPADYPCPEEVHQQFGFSWRYPSFGVPDQLREISQEVWQQEREKAAQRMAEASSEIQIVLRESMTKLVQHMADRLKDGVDGKPLRFKESTVGNLIEFLENFQFRNVTDDHELQAMVDQARGLLQGVAVDDLRNTSELRVKVQQGMANLATELDGLMVRSAGRKFRFEDAA